MRLKPTGKDFAQRLEISEEQRARKKKFSKRRDLAKVSQAQGAAA